MTVHCKRLTSRSCKNGGLVHRGRRRPCGGKGRLDPKRRSSNGLPFFPLASIKKERAQRTSNPAQAIKYAAAFSEKAGNLLASPVNERALLDAIVDRFELIGDIPPELICEWRASRVTFSKNGTRIGRIEFGGTKPDVLLLTSVVEQLRKMSGGDLAIEKAQRLAALIQKGRISGGFGSETKSRRSCFVRHYVDALLAAG